MAVWITSVRDLRLGGSSAPTTKLSRQCPRHSAPNLTAMRGLMVRVQDTPTWSKAFAASGMSPTGIAYDVIYNAIENGVFSASENEAAGVEVMKCFEVGPNLNMRQPIRSDQSVSRQNIVRRHQYVELDIA